MVPFLEKTQERARTKPTRSPSSPHCLCHPSCPQPKPGWSLQGISKQDVRPLSPVSPSMQTQRDAPPLPGGSGHPEDKLPLLQPNSIQAGAQGGQHPSAQRKRARQQLRARERLMSIHPLVTYLQSPPAPEMRVPIRSSTTCSRELLPQSSH